MDRPCKDMQERIADYVLGALDEQEARAVRDHLGGCEACRAYMRSLAEQSEALVALGEQIQDDMGAREDKIIEALEGMPLGSSGPGWVMPWTGKLLRTAVAAVLVLGVGIAIGRLTAAAPIDVEQLRLDLEQSVTASLRPAVQESVLTEVDQRLQAALTDGQATLSATLAAQVRQELRTFGTQFMAGSEAMMERRLDDFMQLIETARLKDRQRVARAFEQIELNRMRDARQLGLGLRTLAIQTRDEATRMEN